VCPLLHRGQLVARFEGQVCEGELHEIGFWPEAEPIDKVAWRDSFAAHSARVSGN
jgi:hypothetical protein